MQFRWLYVVEPIAKLCHSLTFMLFVFMSLLYFSSVVSYTDIGDKACCMPSLTSQFVGTKKDDFWWSAVTSVEFPLMF